MSMFEDLRCFVDLLLSKYSNRSLVLREIDRYLNMDGMDKHPEDIFTPGFALFVQYLGSKTDGHSMELKIIIDFVENYHFGSGGQDEHVN